MVTTPITFAYIVLRLEIIGGTVQKKESLAMGLTVSLSVLFFVPIPIL
jgi:hypothetical protein